MLFDTKVSVFGESSAVINTTLKNPNQFREAVVLEAIRNLPAAKRKEFIHSDEAKYMISEGIISTDMLERLAECDASNTSTMKLAVCNIAKEQNDPLFDELCYLRLQERRVMNELIEKYGNVAVEIANKTKTEIINASIPAYFRN